MERVWMANGAVMPRRSSAVTSFCGRPMDAKVASACGSAAAISAAASRATSRSDLTGGGGVARGVLRDCVDGLLRRDCEPPPRDEGVRAWLGAGDMGCAPLVWVSLWIRGRIA